MNSQILREYELAVHHWAEGPTKRMVQRLFERIRQQENEIVALESTVEMLENEATLAPAAEVWRDNNL